MVAFAFVWASQPRGVSKVWSLGAPLSSLCAPLGHPSFLEIKIQYKLLIFLPKNNLFLQKMLKTTRRINLNV